MDRCHSAPFRSPIIEQPVVRTQGRGTKRAQGAAEDGSDLAVTELRDAKLA